MKRPRRILLAVLVATLASAPALTALDGQRARARAEEFGRALVAGDASRLRALLPERGNVRIHLELLGPEEGAFGSSQVRALFAEVLARVPIREFEVERVDFDPQRFALVHARLMAGAGPRREVAVRLQLTFRPGDDTWLLQEIRETAP